MSWDRGRRCKVCTPQKCRDGFLYVVEDANKSLVKIGMSVNVARRMAQYRANGNTHFILRHKRRAGCEWTTMTREDIALKRLADRAVQVRGDWFDIDVRTAVDIVEDTCTAISREVPV